MAWPRALSSILEGPVSLEFFTALMKVSLGGVGVHSGWCHSNRVFGDGMFENCEKHFESESAMEL